MVKTFEKAVTGFNHNIKHKGKVYHVQTEDSGAANPHLITHLFVGGNILATKKTSYRELVGQENLAERVREMMEEQHKQMLRNLVNGAYDHIDRGVTAYQPGELAVDPPTPAPAPNPPVATPVSRPTPVPLTNPIKPPAPTPAALPSEVWAARQLAETPQENHVGVETLFGEDLISEKSLDEVILSYLAQEEGS